MLTMVCSTVVIIRLPPGLPVASHGLPSANTMVGVIELSGRLPGSMAFASPPSRPNALGTPGFAEKSSISLFNRKPAPATAMPDPYEKFSV